MQKIPPQTPPSHLRRDADAEAHALARRFVEVLRAGDGGAAERVVEDALIAGVTPESVQSLVIEPAMVEIGEQWEQGLISIADEHLATAISERALLRLYQAMSSRRSRARSRERVMLAAVEGQRHMLGLRMVADVLEAAGFEVLYLGEDVPVRSLRAFLQRHRPAVVGLTVGISADVRCLADALWTIHDTAPDTRVMLGGRAVPPGLREVGYPYVRNSMEVVAAVEGLLAGPAQPLPPIVGVLRSSDLVRPTSWRPSRSAELDPVAERLATSAQEALDVAREQVRRAESYRELAFRDPLTDLPNRRAFEEELDALAGARATGVVLMLDVDAFKSINDEHGHATGDRLLHAVGRAISRTVRSDDMAARLGGDEFAVLLPWTTMEIAMEIAERIRVAVACSTSPAVSVSIGAAEASRDTRAAMLAADVALYEAKAAGRDRVAVRHDAATP